MKNLEKMYEESGVKMFDPDFRVRFQAEYVQVKVRQMKLKAMLDKWEANQLNFEPKCSRELLTHQYEVMTQYIDILRQRAQIEEVEL